MNLLVVADDSHESIYILLLLIRHAKKKQTAWHTCHAVFRDASKHPGRQFWPRSAGAQGLLRGGPARGPPPRRRHAGGLRQERRWCAAQLSIVAGHLHFCCAARHLQV